MNGYRIWLTICVLLVFGMVLVGGFTRLSNSGLSITEWKPISGIFFPLTQSRWEEEFIKYKGSPEYKHHSITIKEFKFIYTVEYLHRLLGRMLGAIFFAGLIFFLILGRVEGYSKVRLLFVLFLGLAQGFMGWYMVKSGLVDIPAVSHYRLSMHLFLASMISALLVYEVASCIYVESSAKQCRVVAVILTLMFSSQVILGGFVAGLKAGLIYNTFPLMGGEFIPSEYVLSFDDPVFVQFLHRVNAFVALFVFVLCFLSISDRKFKAQLSIIGVLLVLQIFLGVLTLIFQVPIDIALMHQIVAVVLICMSARLFKVLSVNH